MEIEDIKIYLDNNKGQDFIAEKMNMSRGRAYCYKEAKSINLSFLKMNIDEISELDYKIKSGKIEKNWIRIVYSWRKQMKKIMVTRF